MMEVASGEMTPAERIRAWIREAGWSQQELARRTGLSASAISRILKGDDDDTGRAVGRFAAITIARVTAAAYDAHEVKIAPLRVDDLLVRKAG